MNKSGIVHMLECACHFEKEPPYLFFGNNLPPFLYRAITHVTHAIPASQIEQIIIEVPFLANLALNIKVSALFPRFIDLNTLGPVKLMVFIIFGAFIGLYLW